MQPEAAKIVAHAPGPVVLRVDALQGSQMGAQLCVSETLGLHAKQHQGIEQCLGARIAKAQRRGALPIDFDGAYHLIKSVFADGAVVRDGLDLKESSVGLEADVAKRGQIAQVLPEELGGDSTYGVVMRRGKHRSRLLADLLRLLGVGGKTRPQ